MTGVLRVVGTPLGNLEDMSPRAARALAGAGVIYCEDTRRTRKLLSALGIPTPRLVRLDRHTERATVEEAVAALRDGQDAGLVSDAGMPTISDPGADLVKGVAGAGLALEVVPGPCAVSAAVALSGFPADQFRFAGFLPRKGTERAKALRAVAGEAGVTVIYESPHRVGATIDDLAEACGPARPVAALRELTKLHEEGWRGDLAGAAAWLAGREARGEWVLVVGPAPDGPAPQVGDDEIASAIGARLAAGADRRSAVAAVVADMDLPRRRVYAVAVGLPRPGG